MRGPLDLQINRAGSWLHVCGFNAERLDAVKEACAALVLATGGTVAILDPRHGTHWANR